MAEPGPPPTAAQRPGSAPPDAAAEMARLGITSAPIPCFHYRGYRYTNLADAMAQAKRDELGE